MVDTQLNRACPMNEPTVGTFSQRGSWTRCTEVLASSATGKSNATSISEKEVLLRSQRAMGKLGSATRYEAALRATRLGWVACD